ncbi:MAG TPA: CHASE domain-containing protein [Bacteroidales bacterium]|nr:CHASE domain-containing protein [Bacteroidales bacterium]
MRFPGPNFKLLISGFSLRETLITIGVLILGLAITTLSVLYTRANITRAAIQDFDFSCNELTTKISTRLNEHAQLLRSGQAFFSVSDSVTREEWHNFYVLTKIDSYLPGIQGFGYSKLVPREKLDEHIRAIRKSGFPDYNITPAGDRDLYSTILYIEPFTGMNLRAFGYDMFSEPVRRKAMSQAVDSNSAALSAKVRLVQETGQDIQAGVLMYIPVFKRGMPTETVSERWKALKGWVYSPYRMRDLMSGILSNTDPGQTPLYMRIYDEDVISEENLLFNGMGPDSSIAARKTNLYREQTVLFNGRKWTLVFTGRREELSVFHREQVIVWLTGIVISILLFILSLMLIRANIRSRQIEMLNKRLEQMNSDKDRFMSVLSHDLKSPFTSILGFLELLISGIRKYSIDDIERHLNTINDAAMNTYNLLEDLLMWTRAHSGKIPFSPVKLRFRDVYSGITGLLIPMAEAKNIDVIYEETEPVTVFADNDMIKAVMRNLLSNAIKFTETGGRIMITVSRTPDGIMVSVADNGIGIKPERIKSLFDFTNIISTKGTTGEKGSGLGLVLCREFITRHGGKIWVVSEPGKGSDFRFTLPG